MIRKPTIICAVTNDLNQDRRMHRICNVLVDTGFDVLLVGRKRKSSQPLLEQRFRQFRFELSKENGVGFYAEYNLTLYRYLTRQKPDFIYSVDTDTLLASANAASKIKSKLIFDAHEYYTEVPELNGKRLKKWIWTQVENRYIPKADLCITVGSTLAKIFSEKHAKAFITIRNVPTRKLIKEKNYTKIVLYQGALNEGRGLHEAIDALEYIADQSVELHIVGGGDIERELIDYAKSSPCNDRIVFHGWKTGLELDEITSRAWLGINLLEATSLNYYYSLANKFFDYMHSSVPSINMDFPEYKNILSDVKVGVTISELSGAVIAKKINEIIQPNYEFMQSECKRAIEMYNWENEREKLITALRSLM